MPGSLLARCGWGPGFVWVLDLQTGEGAFFLPGGNARADLMRHQIHVCVLYEAFLEWLYQQDLTALSALPDIAVLPGAPGGPVRVPAPRSPARAVIRRRIACGRGAKLTGLAFRRGRREAEDLTHLFLRRPARI